LRSAKTPSTSQNIFLIFDGFIFVGMRGDQRNKFYFSGMIIALKSLDLKSTSVEVSMREKFHLLTKRNIAPMNMERVPPIYFWFRREWKKLNCRK